MVQLGGRGDPAASGHAPGDRNRHRAPRGHQRHRWRSGTKSRGSAMCCWRSSMPANPTAPPTWPFTPPSATPPATRCSARSCSAWTRRSNARRNRPFSVPGFGLASFPPHRNLSDAIVAGDADAAEAALNTDHRPGRGRNSRDHRRQGGQLTVTGRAASASARPDPARRRPVTPSPPSRPLPRAAAALSCRGCRRRPPERSGGRSQRSGGRPLASRSVALGSNPCPFTPIAVPRSVSISSRCSQGAALATGVSTRSTMPALSPCAAIRSSPSAALRVLDMQADQVGPGLGELVDLRAEEPASDTIRCTWIGRSVWLRIRATRSGKNRKAGAK